MADHEVTVITGEHRIRAVSYLAARSMLTLEIKGMTRRGSPASVYIRRVLGSTTRNKTKLLAEFEFFILAYCTTHDLPTPSFGQKP